MIVAAPFMGATNAGMKPAPTAITAMIVAAPFMGAIGCRRTFYGCDERGHKARAYRDHGNDRRRTLHGCDWL